VPLPAGPPFFGLAAPGAAEKLLAAAGFASPSVREVPLTWRLPSPDALLDAFMEGGVRTRALLRAQEPGALARIREAVREAASDYVEGDGLVLPQPCVLAAGTRP
jgi:hypothetical protein